ncbi:MAG: hypothetical protein KAJ22_05610 [Candidatus Izimaplasma sp.]|nr:hypothetical protein [Candidatus Izimaplasma bacterium]
MGRYVRGGNRQILINSLELAQAKYRLEQIQSCNVNIQKSTNPEALVKSEHEYFLIVAVLIYLYHKDDGIFSSEEKKSIKKEINESKNSISKTTRKELMSMLKMDYGEVKILQLIKDYKIKKKMIKTVIKMFEEQFTDERIHLNNLRILDEYILDRL